MVKLPEPVGYWREGYFDELKEAQSYCDHKAQLAVVLRRPPTDFAARREEMSEEYKSGFDGHPDSGETDAD